MKQIKDMTLAELEELVFRSGKEFDEAEVTDRLAVLVWQIGVVWDKAEETDPHKGQPRRLGTNNHRSMVYKLRKVAGFSYP